MGCSLPRTPKGGKRPSYQRNAVAMFLEMSRCVSTPAAGCSGKLDYATKDQSTDEKRASALD